MVKKNCQSTVRGGLVEFFAKLKLELRRIEGGRGLDVPVAFVLGHLRKNRNISKAGHETSKAWFMVA